jgi:hypothetical protein
MLHNNQDMEVTLLYKSKSDQGQEVSLPRGQVVQLIMYFTHGCAIADKHNAG